MSVDAVSQQQGAVGVPDVPPRRGPHPLLRYTGRRLAAGVATLLAASFLIFFAVNVLPGDVASVILGKNATPATADALRDELDLNRPFLEQYGSWIAGVAHGDLGDSAVALAQGSIRAPVVGLIGTPMRNSAILAVITIVLLIPLSLVLGVVSGVHAGRPADHGISMTALVLGALPEFVLGTFLILIFFSQLDLLPPVALVSPGQTPLSRPTALVLPVLTLLGVATAFSARQIRAGMIEVLRQDYVAFARINGLPERRVLWRYALRNALAPSVQIFAQTIQYLLGGIIIVESVFVYPGIGTLLINAVLVRDVTVVEGIAMMLAAIYILINIVADLIVVFLVPKLRTGLG